MAKGKNVRLGRWLILLGGGLAVAGWLVFQFRTRPAPSPVKLSLLAQQRAAILQSPWGVAPATNLVRALTQVRGGAEAQLAFQSLALRKAEALPVVRAHLRHGEMFEKFILTKFLRYCPWPETRPELVALARDTSQSWMPRQGALYALAALGDQTAGPAIALILHEPNCPTGVRLAAIAALARINYRKAADDIRPYTQVDDIHLRLFAMRALAEFGESVDNAFLTTALRSPDYIVRQEACGALGAVGLTGPLPAIADRDPHEAVRDAAAQALLAAGLRGQLPTVKVASLRDALPRADRHTATWIVRTMLEQGGSDGRAFVEELATHADYLGERSRVYLIWETARNT